MIVHHYYPHTGNIGDHFIADAIRRLVSHHRPGAQIIPFPVNRHRRDERQPFGLQGENLDRTNEDAGLVIIGGSNLYEFNRHGRWGVATDVDSLRRLRVPVLLLGIGHGSRRRDDVRPGSRESLAEIRLLNEQAVGSSVRDTITLEFLHRMKIDKPVLTGCPATFLFDQTLVFNEHPQAAIAMPPARFRKDRLRFFCIVRAIRKYIRYCRDRSLSPVLACHTSEDADLVGKLRFAGAEVFCSDRTEDYYALYRQSRMVMAFRLHAAIISLSLGTPFVPVNFDQRGQGFVETYESEDWAIDAARWGLYKGMAARTESILGRDESAFERFVANKGRLHALMHEFLRNALSGGGSSA